MRPIFGGKTSWVKIWDAEHDLSYPTQCFRILFKHHAPSLLQCSQTLHPHLLLHDFSFCFKSNLQTLIHHEHTKTHLLKTPNPSTSQPIFIKGTWFSSHFSLLLLLRFNICKSDIWMLQEARNRWGLKAHFVLQMDFVKWLKVWCSSVRPYVSAALSFTCLDHLMRNMIGKQLISAILWFRLLLNLVVPCKCQNGSLRLCVDDEDSEDHSLMELAGDMLEERFKLTSSGLFFKQYCDSHLAPFYRIELVTRYLHT
ncbi:hypothetical protein Hanom_Chr02g00105231 [Helianthus anomalus]